MSRSPSFDLQASVRSTLLASEAVRAFVGDRVYDSAQAGRFPYIHLADDYIQGEQDAGGEFYRCDVNVHVYAEGPASAQVRKLSDVVADALDTTLILDNFTCHETFVMDVRSISDPDGTTQHRVVRIQYLLQATD